MRASDEDFSLLYTAEEFSAYYEALTVDELVEELVRLEKPASGGLFKVMSQYTSIYRRLVDVSCFDQTLTDPERSLLIRVAGDLREALETIIIPRLKPDFAENLRKALAATDDTISRFGYYPRAVDMVLTRARNPSGPYKLGVMGEIAPRNPSDP